MSSQLRGNPPLIQRGGPQPSALRLYDWAAQHQRRAGFSRVRAGREVRIQARHCPVGEGDAIAGVEVAFRRQSIGQQHAMPTQFDMVVRHPVRRLLHHRRAPRVLALVALGRSYRLVGREMGLSKNTVAGIVKRSRALSMDA